MADFFLLGFLGGHPAEEPYITASRLASLFYFAFFIIILPLTSMLECIIADEIVTECKKGAVLASEINRGSLHLPYLPYGSIYYTKYRRSSQVSS